MMAVMLASYRSELVIANVCTILAITILSLACVHYHLQPISILTLIILGWCPYTLHMAITIPQDVLIL